MTVRLHGFVLFCFAVALIIGVAAPPVLAQTGQMGGTIYNEDGVPLEGVAIVASTPETRYPDKVTTTDSNGRFSLNGFSSAQWTFTCSLDGFHPFAIPVNVRQGRNPPMSLELIRVRHNLELALGEEALEGMDPVAIEAEMEAADEAFNSEQWDTAIAGYMSILEKLPQLTNLQMSIGNSYRAKGEYAAAITAYEQVLADEPDNGDAKAEIARTKLAMGDFDAASEELAQAASGLDAAREDLYNLGELEFAKGDVDAAAVWYEKATAVDPNWGKPLFKLALVALNKGDTATAKQFFAKVVAVDPDSQEGAQAKATLSALP